MHDIRLQELRLFTDYGRCCRPLFIVDLRQQRLHIRKEHVRQLQDRETTAFGWQARGLCFILRGAPAVVRPHCLLRAAVIANEGGQGKFPRTTIELTFSVGWC